MPTFNHTGVSIYYEVHGKSDNPSLLLSHGFSSTSEMWAGQISTLSKSYMLILWDMRGHGRTDYPQDPSAYSEFHCVSDMAALLDLVCGHGSRAVVGGLSLGGYMSLAFHLAHPERVNALLIIDTGPGFKQDVARDGWNKYAHSTGDRFEREGLRSLQTSSHEASTVHHYSEKGLVFAARGMLTQRNSKVIDSLPHIKIPALVVVGADDKPFLTASIYMARKIPRARRVVIPNAGHAVNIDQPILFNEAVVSFLADLNPQQKLIQKSLL